MKRIGFLILAIITSLACCLGTVGSSKEKEKELNMLDYFENKVSYSLYTTDESSKYYDAEKGYGIMEIMSDMVLYNDFPYDGLTTNYIYMSNGEIWDILLKQFNCFMFTPKNNINKIKLKGIEFSIVADIDCELQFQAYQIVGLNMVAGETSYPKITCKAGEEQRVSFVHNVTWTKEEAEKITGGAKKKILIGLQNKQCGARWAIFNLNFVLEKV